MYRPTYLYCCRSLFHHLFLSCVTLIQFLPATFLLKFVNVCYILLSSLISKIDSFKFPKNTAERRVKNLRSLKTGASINTIIGNLKKWGCQKPNQIAAVSGYTRLSIFGARFRIQRAFIIIHPLWNWLKNNAHFKLHHLVFLFH